MAASLPRDKVRVGKRDMSTAQVLRRHKYFLTDEIEVFQVRVHDLPYLPVHHSSVMRLS